MLQQEQAEDFVIATGEQHAYANFINLAASKLEMKLTGRHGSGREGLRRRGPLHRGD